MTTSKNDKIEEERWNILGVKKKAIQVKQTVQIKEINQKAKEGKLEIYRNKIKQSRQSRTFRNNERNSTRK